MRCKGVWSLIGARRNRRTALWTSLEGCGWQGWLFGGGRWLSANNLPALYSHRHLEVNSYLVQLQGAESTASRTLYFHLSCTFRWSRYLVRSPPGRDVLYSKDCRQQIKTVLSSMAVCLIWKLFWEMSNTKYWLDLANHSHYSCLFSTPSPRDNHPLHRGRQMITAGWTIFFNDYIRSICKLLFSTETTRTNEVTR